MAQQIDHDEIMRYLDGEASPDARQRIEALLESSTELQRDLALFRSMKEDFRELSFTPVRPGSSVWDSVNRQLARPVGWVFLLAGLFAWAAYGAYVFLVEPRGVVEKLATGAIVIGILLLLASVIWERYRDWLTDPYKDVHR